MHKKYHARENRKKVSKTMDQRIEKKSKKKSGHREAQVLLWIAVSDVVK